MPMGWAAGPAPEEPEGTRLRRAPGMEGSVSSFSAGSGRRFAVAFR